MAAFRQFKNLGAILLGLSVLTSAGGHLLALQSIAWASMLWSNAKQESALVAVQKTFDGKHPCSRCHEIGAEQAQQSKIPPQEIERRFDPAYLTTLTFEARAWKMGIVEWHSTLDSLRSQGRIPPTPPPRPLSLSA